MIERRVIGGIPDGDCVQELLECGHGVVVSADEPKHEYRRCPLCEDEAERARTQALKEWASAFGRPRLVKPKP